MYINDLFSLSKGYIYYSFGEIIYNSTREEWDISHSGQVGLSSAWNIIYVGKAKCIAPSGRCDPSPTVLLLSRAVGDGDVYHFDAENALNKNSCVTWGHQTVTVITVILVNCLIYMEVKEIHTRRGIPNCFLCIKYNKTNSSTVRSKILNLDIVCGFDLLLT